MAKVRVCRGCRPASVSTACLPSCLCASDLTQYALLAFFLFLSVSPSLSQVKAVEEAISLTHQLRNEVSQFSATQCDTVPLSSPLLPCCCHSHHIPSHTSPTSSALLCCAHRWAPTRSCGTLASRRRTSCSAASSPKETAASCCRRWLGEGGEGGKERGAERL